MGNLVAQTNEGSKRLKAASDRMDRYFDRLITQATASETPPANTGNDDMKSGEQDMTNYEVDENV